MPRRKPPSSLLKFTKFIFWIAVAVFILTIGFSIYVFCNNNPPTADRNPALTGFPTIISPIPLLSPTPSIPSTTYVISYVHDGDTVYVAPHNQSVRLIGIDAPELAGSYRCGVDAACTKTTEECGATAAKNKLKELVLNQEVVLVEDGMTNSTDKYGRLLRYVLLVSSSYLTPTTHNSQTALNTPLDLSLEMIRLGLSRESGFGNSYTNQKQYREAETEAKTKKLGIWGKCE